MQPTHCFQETVFSSFVTSGAHQALSHTLLQTGHTESAFAVNSVTASKSGLQGEKQESETPNKASLKIHSENGLDSRKVNSLYFAAAAVSCHTLPSPPSRYELGEQVQQAAPFSKLMFHSHLPFLLSPDTR